MSFDGKKLQDDPLVEYAAGLYIAQTVGRLIASPAAPLALALAFCAGSVWLVYIWFPTTVWRLLKGVFKKSRKSLPPLPKHPPLPPLS